MIEMLQWMAKYLLFVFATLGVDKLKPIFSLLVSAQKTFIECVFLVAGLFGTWKLTNVKSVIQLVSHMYYQWKKIS